MLRSRLISIVQTAARESGLSPEVGERIVAAVSNPRVPFVASQVFSAPTPLGDCKCPAKLAGLAVDELSVGSPLDEFMTTYDELMADSGACWAVAVFD